MPEMPEKKLEESETLRQEKWREVEAVLLRVQEIQARLDSMARDFEALRLRLDEAPSLSTTEEAFARKLAAKGLVSMATGSPPPVTPVPISGKPVSEVILEERR